MGTVDSLEVVWLAMLIPGFIYALWALRGAWQDERYQRHRQVNGDILLGARSRLRVYIALLAAQGFMLALGILLALASNGGPHERSWLELVLIVFFMGLGALTSIATWLSHRDWQELVEHRNARQAERPYQGQQGDDV